MIVRAERSGLWTLTAPDGGVYQRLRIGGNGAMRWFDLDGDAILELEKAITAIERDPTGEFVISPDLTLVCEAPAFELRNCAVSFRWPTLADPKKLVERIREHILVNQLFGN